MKVKKSGEAHTIFPTLSSLCSKILDPPLYLSSVSDMAVQDKDYTLGVRGRIQIENEEVIYTFLRHSVYVYTKFDTFS